MQIRTLIFIVLVAGIIPACLRSSVSAYDSGRFEKKVRKEVLKIAETYAAGNIKDPKKEVTKEGLITIGSAEKTYVIDPSRIFIGRINQDTINDAIVTLFPFVNNYEVTSEHLFLIDTDGRLMMVRSMESDMRVISIQNGIITAEVPEHSRNSPLFNCPSCWEVVKYRFINGELDRVE